MVEAEVDEIMAIADLNGNGELDYSEWLVATLKRSDMINTKKLKQAFMYFDKDGSGKISLDELKDAMQGNGQDLEDDVFMDIMAEGDENGDGEIDFEEFKNMMKKLLARPQDSNDKRSELVVREENLEKANPFRKIRVEKEERQQGNM